MKTYDMPSFAGKRYGSKGSYENPRVAIDSSGNAYASAIRNIGNSTANAIREKTKRNSQAVQQTQKYLDKNAEFVLNNYDEFSMNMEKVGINNPSLNKAGLFAIDKKANAYMAMKSAKTKEDQTRYAQEYALWDGKINELTQLVTAGQEANQSYSADYVDGYSKVNTEGGVSTTNANVGLSKQYQLAMPTRIGATRNPNEQWFFDENDNWRIKTMYSSDQITKAYKDGDIENNYVVADPKVLFSFDGGKVPNITADRNKFFQESGITDKNGNLGDPYVGEPRLEKTKNGDFEYQFRPQLTGEIEAATQPFIAAQTRSFLKFPEKAKNIWSHVLNKYGPEGYELKYADGQVGTAFDEESSDVFSQAYTAWFYDDLNKKGGNASNYRKITPEKPTVAETKASEKASKEKVSLEVIDKIEIPTAQGVGPAEEGSQFLDMQALEKSVAPYGFRVKSALQVGGTGGFTLTKNVDGTDRTVTIFETMSPKEIKDLMKFVETGEQIYAPAEKPNLPFTN